MPVLFKTTINLILDILFQEFYETKIQYYRLTLCNALATVNNSQKSFLQSQAKELDAIRSAIHSFGNQDIEVGFI